MLRASKSRVALILTTVPDDGRAETIASALINERLVACVNVFGPVISIYQWKGAVEREAERQMVIKTTTDRTGAIADRLSQMHPYDLPEFVVLPAEAGQAYEQWVRDSVDSPAVETRGVRRRRAAAKRRRSRS